MLYHLNDEEVSKEFFTSYNLEKPLVKVFKGDSIFGYEYRNLELLFNGKYKSKMEINKHLEKAIKAGEKDVMEYLKGVKETEGKTDYSEINLEILDLMAERFTANKHKYPKGNMKKPIDIKSLEWALFRHVKKMIQPIETDEETYKDHLSAVLCNCSMILDQLNKR